MKKLFRILFLGVGVLLICTLSAAAQEKTRSFTKSKAATDAPVTLIEAGVSGRAFDSEWRINAGSDWLRDVRLTVKNCSAKEIVFIKIDLVVEPAGRMTYPMRIPVTFGRLATPKELTEAMADTSTSRIVVSPNQTVIARIPPGVGEAAYKSLVASNADIEQVRLAYDFIVFSDGTAWSEGREMRQNPNNPDQWDPVRSTAAPRATSPNCVDVNRD